MKKLNLWRFTHLASIVRPKVYVELGILQCALFNRVINFAEQLIGVDINEDAGKYMSNKVFMPVFFHIYQHSLLSLNINTKQIYFPQYAQYILLVIILYYDHFEALLITHSLKYSTN